MKLTKELAEIIGMFAADGCLQKEYICMWGNISEDKDYYDKVVCPLFSKVFKKKIIAHEKKSNSVYGFYLCNKKAIEFFRKIGFSNNKTYNLKVPEIVLKSNNQEMYAAFIRGFADCDGGFSLMKRKGKYKLFKKKFHTYPRIDIRSVSKEVIADLTLLLKKLSIDYTSWVEKRKKLKEKDMHRITIRGISKVEKWMNKISFDNPAQFTRYQVWKKFGFCPIRTTLEQRKLILQNKLDPYSFYKKTLPVGFEPTTSSFLS